MIIECEKNNMKKIEKLSDLRVGEKGKIIALNITNKIVRRHLLDMGLVRGTIVEVKKIAPMGDPVDLFLRNYQLCIRKSDLKQIDVEVI